MPTDSLAFRLLLTSALWVSATLALTGMLLVFLFRQHIEFRFDLDAREHLDELVSSCDLDPQGRFVLGRPRADPRYERPRSGWYWQIWHQGEAQAQSASLWYEGLDLGPTAIPSQGEIRQLLGPGGEALRVLVQGIGLPGKDQPFVFAVAGPRADIERDVHTFTHQLAITLGALGIGLLGAVAVQVRFGLRPLRHLGAALARIRTGQAARLPESFPREVQPVVAELNGLLDHNAALLARARTQAGDLAHALKNPLTVIGNEAHDIPDEPGRVLREQVSAMGIQVQRYLSQARVAGAGILGARAPVAPIVVGLIDSLRLLYADRGLEFSQRGLEVLSFRGDAQDLEEMLGNLMDNACKWARRRVAVGGRREGDRLRIWVEDDGPGVPAAARGEVLRRGRRLDEQVPGSGLGLAIVCDIAELYRGRLDLADSAWGGLRAELELPAAETS